MEFGDSPSVDVLNRLCSYGLTVGAVDVLNWQSFYCHEQGHTDLYTTDGSVNISEAKSFCQRAMELVPTNVDSITNVCLRLSLFLLLLNNIFLTDRFNEAGR